MKNVSVRQNTMLTIVLSESISITRAATIKMACCLACRSKLSFGIELSDYNKIMTVLPPRPTWKSWNLSNTARNVMTNVIV